MANRVVSFFENRAQAQQAVERLIQAGLPLNRINVSAGTAGVTGLACGPQKDTEPARNIPAHQKTRNGGDAISQLFDSLFGDGSDEATHNYKLAQSSSVIVTVRAATIEESRVAANILDNAGATDVNNRSFD